MASARRECMVGIVSTASRTDARKNCHAAQRRCEPRGCMLLQDPRGRGFGRTRRPEQTPVCTRLGQSRKSRGRERDQQLQSGLRGAGLEEGPGRPLMG